MVKAHAGKVAAARQIGEGGGVITLGANDRCVLPGTGQDRTAFDECHTLFLHGLVDEYHTFFLHGTSWYWPFFYHYH